MKKKTAIGVIAAILVVILFVPIPTGRYKDGGTRVYSALTYRIVKWNRITEDGGVYEKTRVYFLADRFRSIESLWDKESPFIERTFRATVIELDGDHVVVEPEENESERESSDRIAFFLEGADKIGAEVGSVVEVTYTGEIRETYPASIDAVSWKLCKDMRNRQYQGQWLDKNAANKVDYQPFADIVITEIYSDCFFAHPVVPMPYQIKINGKLPDEWCVGDQVAATCANVYYDEESQRMEADLQTVAESDFQLEPGVCYKPVIYLYPEREMDVSVRLALDGSLTCTYPAYQDGWKVKALPDGTLMDEDGQSYNYLYWEGETYARYDLSEGFCIKGADTAAFLEEALAKLGLTRREANEFIVYWLPLMEKNPYNIISFQTDRYTDGAKLKIEPAPDTLLRVFMAWQPADTYVQLQEQHLAAPERTGFTVVEWGGTEVLPEK